MPVMFVYATAGDPAEASRAPVGTAIVGDVALALEHLLELVGVSERAAPVTEPVRMIA